MIFDPTAETKEIHAFVTNLGQKGGKVGALRIGQQKRGPGKTSHFGITIDKTEFAGMMKRINAYQHIPEAGRFAMYNVQTYIQGEVLPERFASEGRGKWKKLTDSTNTWRKRVGAEPAHPMLNVKGFYMEGLLGSDLWKTAKTGKYARLEFDPERLSNTPSFYPKIKGGKASVRDKFFVHQLGATNQYGAKIPQRRVFPTFASDFSSAQKKIIKYKLTEGVLDYLESEYHHARVEKRKIRRVG